MNGNLKAKLKKNQLTIGSWITIGHPTVAELMARSGFGWLAIDMEHSPLSVSECQELVRTIDLCQVPALVRVGSNDSSLIKRAMEAGACGVIVPMVNSKEEATKAVSSVRYPPLGTRGVGLARAQGYGQNFEAYKKWANKNAIVIVQIEHIRAVECVDEILSVEGVDGVMIGPYDLSGSLGKPGDFENPKFIAAMRKVHEAAKKHKMPSGFHVVSSDERLLAQRIKQGYNFIAYGVDFLFIQENCMKGLAAIKKR
jgi:2-keto-3-deoxy-L-rhamnonate aldolase RhmA